MYCTSCGKPVISDTVRCPSCGAGATNAPVGATKSPRPSGMSALAIAAIVLCVTAVPIIGILAAIALPAYQDYATRSRVSEGLVAAEEAKRAVNEYFVTRGVFPSSNAEVDFPGFSSKSVASIEIGARGTILVTYSEPEGVAGKYITLTPSRTNEVLYWDCKMGTIDQRYRPNLCR